ncbi:hypothetical protein [Azospirillum palustre]
MGVDRLLGLSISCLFDPATGPAGRADRIDHAVAMSPLYSPGRARSRAGAPVPSLFIKATRSNFAGGDKDCDGS